MWKLWERMLLYSNGTQSWHCFDWQIADLCEIKCCMNEWQCRRKYCCNSIGFTVTLKNLGHHCSCRQCNMVCRLWERFLADDFSFLAWEKHRNRRAKGRQAYWLSSSCRVIRHQFVCVLNGLNDCEQLELFLVLQRREGIMFPQLIKTDYVESYFNLHHGFVVLILAWKYGVTSMTACIKCSKAGKSRKSLQSCLMF